MTERGKAQLSRSADHLTVGPSSMHWEGGSLVVRFDEWSVPIPKRVRGTVRITPEIWGDRLFVLNDDGQHIWHPLAPRARVEVDCMVPDLKWKGTGYLDHNRGDAPIATGFREWTWLRAAPGDGAMTAYSGERRNGDKFAFGITFDADKKSQLFSHPAMQKVASTGWRVHRDVPADQGHDPRVIDTLEDTPFYARSVMQTQLQGQKLEAMHESLSLDRLRHPIVQRMLPFRMPRRV